VAAGADPATVDAADAKLRDIASTLASDPFGCKDADLDAVRTEIARAEAERTSATELRAALTRRLAAAHTLADAVDAATRAAAAARETVAGRFADDVIAAGGDGPELRPDLAAIDALAAAGHWSLIGARLSVWSARARERHTAAEGATARNTALMTERSELRGRLDAYQAKAARRGWAEHPTLSTLAETAREALYTPPCDLPAARVAVAAYQDAIAELTATNAREAQQ
jgi:hypothetical protein